jgi:hypothetical protein
LIPIFVIVYALLGLAMSIVVALLSIVSPQLALMVSVLLGLALTSFPMMIGLQLGFNARRHEVVGTYGSLVIPAMIYGCIEALGVITVIIAGAVTFTVISPELSIADLGNTSAFTDGSAVERALETGDTSVLVIFLFGLLAISVLRAALLVPLAGAAAGRDASGQLHTPLVGFGVGLLPLTILVILSYIALPLIVLVGMTLANVVSPTEVFSSGDGTDWESYGLPEVLLIVSFWVGWIWVFCLQCAGGVLCYLRQREDYVVQKAQAPEEARMDSVDARALWQSRMQKK